MSDGPLRIAWAMPCAWRSGIGRDQARVAQVLAARGHQVEVIATDLGWDADAPHHGPPLPLHHWRDLDLDAIGERFDAVVVQWGDNFSFHAGGFELVSRWPCLGVIHDVYLHDLFQGWLWWRGSRPGEREAEIAATYGGTAGAREAAAAAGGVAEIAQALPMTEWLAARCAAAVVHADFYRPQVAAACPGPVFRADLPVPPRRIPTLPQTRGRPPILMTVGVMNANKAVDRVIAAIAASPALRDTVTYRLTGPIDPAEQLRLTLLAERLGFPRLEIYGGVDDATLNAHLAEADILVALRRPLLEGASGSAVEALLAGRPTIVADAGFYAELPDAVVLKVPAELPVEAITAHLEALAADEPRRRALGARARAYAEATFTAQRYADALEPALRIAAAAGMAQRVRRRMDARIAALGLAADDAAHTRVAGALTGLFGSDVMPR